MSTSTGTRVVPPAVARVLPDQAVGSLDEYLAAGGGSALAHTGSSDDLIAMLATAGLRGRGGAGFSTARKWETVRDYATGAADRPTVVVNGAEGEPGSFKDRMLIRRDPFGVLEGALLAARAVDADRVVVALKETFVPEQERMRAAVDAVTRAGWCRDVQVDVRTGPAGYLFGEETALLEVLDGRPPFPRVAPPFRRGVEDVSIPDAPHESADPTAAHVELAGPSAQTFGVPTLVDNVETLAHAALVVARGPDWFRLLGTEASPGTVVCTVSGDAPRHGVAEYPLGTPVAEVLSSLGDVRRDDVLAVMPGISAAWLTGADLDLPLTYEDFEAVGSGLGTAGFIVIGRDTDPVAVAAGVARFLAVESCGQCTPCKQDGRRIAEELAAIVTDTIDATEHWSAVDAALATVADGARCALAGQQQAAVGAALARFGPDVRKRAGGAGRTVVDIAPIRDLDGDRFVLDATESHKQPDWTLDPVDSGQSPADRLGPGAPAGSG